MNRIPILVLTGPTAVGKTALSIELAKRLDAEIVSADSMQIYRYMDIGSAKVTKKEMDGVRHHLIDIVDPDEEFSVSEFKTLAEKAIADIHKRGKFPIITGGTGLYLNSLIYDMDFGKTQGDDRIRAQLSEEYEKYGKDHLYEKLKSISPQAAERIHPNNVKRVIRALEVCLSGNEMGDFSNDLKLNPKYDARIVILNRNRDILYDRINMRVDIMMENGLLDEVKSLYDRGYTSDLVSMKAIGYKEIIDYLKGNCSLEKSVDAIKQGSRRYAKRQITWFKRYKNSLWIDMDKVTDIDRQIEIIEEYIK